ncbi:MULTISPECIES: hypothetical protein [Streptomyces]|uniref:HNH endonuclease n=1 Tax=Streptomyces antibioticus TaxID=1890 RepID=A0AAE6Y853_STRAT|nr:MULTISPECIES: hypothetical protein [Streptomyces]NUV60002.1 hypothetical protein [Streptomyces sp. CAI-85]OOQ52217.1 hypothetical protein AFM16_14960 [Streptomyces antibioticus]QIT44740.1 hypothetical protein HCX60_15170 [Streptomyces antibioticus]
MTLPSWQSENLGSMARTALWLLQVVGVDGTFTKVELREAFPDVAQIDRRLRDLRDHGWKIDTSRDDPTLTQQEQRFVAAGAEVWLPGKAKAPKHKASITAAQRAKILAADSYMCRACGVAAGELYEDSITPAVLNIARRKVLLPDGSTDYQTVTECKRCGAGGSERTVELAQVLAQVNALAPMERQVLTAWIEADQRTLGPLEKAWGVYRSLPENARKAVAAALAGDND